MTKLTTRKSTSSRLTDMQLIVLSRAVQRDDGAATLPDGMTEKAAHKLAATLVERKFVREIRAKPGMPAWRRSEEGRSHALILTKLGRTAIEVEDDRESEHTELGAEASASTDKAEAVQSGPRNSTPGQQALGCDRSAGPKEGRRHRGVDCGHELAAAHHARSSDGIAQARLRDRTRALGEGRLGLSNRQRHCIRPGGLTPWAVLNHRSRWLHRLR